MRKIVVTFLGLMVFAISGLLIFVAIQPDEFSVERSAVVKAPPAAIYHQVNDLKAWDAWSPFKELDPKAKMEFSTPSEGKGARVAWDGNEQVGKGTMTILESTPHERIVIEQVFERPSQGAAKFIFTFTPDPSGTKATWRMEGKHDSFIAKAICQCMNLDAMLGPKFEQGLAKMKTTAESAEKKESP